MEILNSTEILTDWAGVIVFITSIIAGITGAIAVVEFIAEDEYKTGVICALVSVISLLVIVWAFVVPEQITQHQVVITDMSEFDAEKYEIIRQDGRIFTVNEK